MSHRITVERFPVNPWYYYIVDFTHLNDVMLIRYHFFNKRCAERIIACLPKKRTKHYQIISGEEIQKHPLKYQQVGRGEELHHNHKLGGLMTVPEKRFLSKRERKKARYVQRKRLKRLGFYTTRRVKLCTQNFHQEGIQRIQLPPTSKGRKKYKNTLVYTKDSKPHMYYRILERIPSEDPQVLFIIKAVRFNNRTGVIKKVTTQVLYTDIVEAFLNKELKQLMNEKIEQGLKTREYYHKRGFINLVDGKGPAPTPLP